MTSRLSVTVRDAHPAHNAHPHNLLLPASSMSADAHAIARDTGACAHHSAPPLTADSSADHHICGGQTPRAGVRTGVRLDALAVLALTALARPMRGWV